MSNYKNTVHVLSALDAIINDGDTPQPIMSWAVGLAEALSGPMEPLDKFVKGTPLPSGIGALADEYAEVRERRLALDKEAQAVKDRETEIYKMILSELSESSDTGAAGNHHRVQMVEKDRLNVEDWTQVHGFIRENNLFELLQKRLSDKAVMDLADQYNGQLPPGVKLAKVPSLSFSKVN